MSFLSESHVSDLRGAVRVGIDAALGITAIVERMHGAVQRTPLPLAKTRPDAAAGVAGAVYATVRGGMRLVGRTLDASLAALSNGQAADAPSPARDVAVAALNGVYGDYLTRTGNPLATPMALRFLGRTIDAHDPGSARAVFGENPPGRLLVLAHGLCMDDRQWRRDGHDHGAALAAEFGYAPVYLRYNTGRHIADNGRELAALLDTLVARWPVPVRDVTILGHSMGGLVARSAAAIAQAEGQAWRKLLRAMIFLGTPHCGAPLERLGSWIDRALAVSPYSAPFASLGAARSAGIQDLRRGAVAGDSFVPLPEGVRCYALAATLEKRASLVGERLIGDGLVPLDSALGRRRDGAPSLDFPEDRRWVGYGTGHLDLLASPEAFAQMKAWLAANA